MFTFANRIQSTFVSSKENGPLGAMKCGSFEIPAFGPQLHPLSDVQMFGCHRTDTQWSCLSAQKEIWFEYECTDQGFMTRFVGMTSAVPVFFVFYVKAEQAIVGQEIFLPRSLQRYHDASKTVTFQSNGDSFSIENQVPTKLQLIPLAGNGCFWDSDFLLAFEIPVHDPRTCFQFV